MASGFCKSDNSTWRKSDKRAWSERQRKDTRKERTRKETRKERKETRQERKDTRKERTRKDTRDRQGYVRPDQGKRAPFHNHGGIKGKDWFSKDWVSACCISGANPVPRAFQAAERVFASMSTAEFKARHDEEVRKQRRFVLGEATHFHTRLAELFIDADRESYIGSFLEHSTCSTRTCQKTYPFVLDDVALRSLSRPTHSPVRPSCALMTSGVILPAHVQKRGSFCIICKDGEAAEQESWEEEVAEDRDGKGVDACPGDMDAHRGDIADFQNHQEEEIAHSRIYSVGGHTCFRVRACESPNRCGRVFCDCRGWGDEALSNAE